MLFKKTPGGERWYVSTIDLSYSSSNPLLKQIDRPNLQVSFYSWFPAFLVSCYWNEKKKTTQNRIFHIFQVKLSSDSNLLFPTPVGKSYMCNESDIVLYSRVRNSKLIFHWNPQNQNDSSIFRMKTIELVIQQYWICENYACKVLCTGLLMHGDHHTNALPQVLNLKFIEYALTPAIRLKLHSLPWQTWNDMMFFFV